MNTVRYQSILAAPRHRETTGPAEAVTGPRYADDTVEVAAVTALRTINRRTINRSEVSVLAAVTSATLQGVDGQPVVVEIHVGNGLPAYTVVGLPDTAVRESRERVRAALLSSRLPWPMRRITVNLAPGGVRKTGAGLELAVALGILVANDTDGKDTGGNDGIPPLDPRALDGVGVLGELGLDGTVRPVPGAFPLVASLAEQVHTVILPEANAAEATLVAGVKVRVARHLRELHACLGGDEPWPDPPEPMPREAAHADDLLFDLADVRGLARARRALEAAAAGGHHLYLCGPPGAGKTMLAHRVRTILPPLDPDEALDVTRVLSVTSATPPQQLADERPFRSPHHTASAAALVGGGSGQPRPGEITRAHRGCLFLDELGEFPRPALDALRQPLEERVVQIARQRGSVTFPAAIQLLACSNPCPCGRGGPACRCSERNRDAYRRRISAPLLDRFELRIALTPPEPADVSGESSAVVRERVVEAAKRQRRRYADRPWRTNAEVPPGAFATDLPLDRDAHAAWRDTTERHRLTGRGAAGIRRVARTLADLDGSSTLSAEHIHAAALLRDDVP